jgi:hypothetical protein
VAKFPSSLHVRWAAAFEVATPGFKTIVEALALDIAELLRWRIPAAVILVVVILTVRLLRMVLGLAVLGHEQGGCSQGESKRWKNESSQLHEYLRAVYAPLMR